MKPATPDQFLKMYKKRSVSREKLESIRALGIMLEAEGDDLGTYLQSMVEDLYTLRQAAFGGRKYAKDRHWKEDA